ncbi:EamA family transporter [Agrococcus sp. SGAir0287]|uniref:EamA family transporter n=1 Tax=Agrococcus sp. SGAir0287 TaxID=2070347 RepID=UPI0010CD4EEE|nr:DMT family transporter [Agrococcus sp. SGAir0287]QCR20039.1 EamA family transporter [Agrococcus sp. SGAir0287]
MLDRRGFGLLLCIAAAASFGLSGIFASALIASGWSPGAVTAARISLAALVMLVPALLALRGRWATLWAGRWQVLLFGTFAVAICQLAYFSAVQRIPPALALLIEFLGPVLLVGWTWARTRRSPAALTLVGAGLAVLGLGLVSGVGQAESLDPIGIGLALVSAVGNAVYWASAASTTHGLPPVTLAGLGLAVGGVLLLVAGAIGILPMTVATAPTELAGMQVPMMATLAVLVLVATVAAYVLGVSGVRRLGATLSSFLGYSEPLFGVLWMALLLALVPTPVQWLGGAAILAGVVLVRAGELRRPRDERDAVTAPVELPLVVPEEPATDQILRRSTDRTV